MFDAGPLKCWPGFMRLLVQLLLSLLWIFHACAEVSLTADQLRAVLVVSGDRASGTAFVANFRGETCVVTNQHVLAGQTNLKIRNSDGHVFRGNRFIAATDLDLMMVVLKEKPEGMMPLELAEEASKIAAIGDEVLVPGNSKGDGVITVTQGKVVAIGPNKIEVDTPVFPGNSGGPIIHAKTGRVVGVLTEASVVSSDPVTKESLQNKNSQIKQSIRYFGHRVDAAGAWEDLDWKKFNEATALTLRAKKELEALYVFLTGRGEAWKEFADLHSAWNTRNKIVHDGRQSEKGKLDAAERFVRSLDSFARAPVARLKGAKLYYIQQAESDQIKAMSANLIGGIELVSRDLKLLNR